MTIHPPLPAVRPVPPSPLGAGAAGSAPLPDVASPSLPGSGATLSDLHTDEIDLCVHQILSALDSMEREQEQSPAVRQYMRSHEFEQAVKGMLDRLGPMAGLTEWRSSYD